MHTGVTSTYRLSTKATARLWRKVLLNFWVFPVLPMP